MRCTTCHNGDLHEERRHKSATRQDRVAVVTDVPVLACPACGEAFYTEEVAIALDAMLTRMLDEDTIAVRSFTANPPQAA